jgi:transcriptional regulator
MRSLPNDRPVTDSCGTYSGLAIEVHSSADHLVKGQLQRKKKDIEIRGLNKNCNHNLKNLFKGAAARASSKPGPFQEFYAALVAKGMRSEMARLTLIYLANREEGISSNLGNRGEFEVSKPTDLVQGTLDLLLLKILALEPLHGWAISQRLKQVSGDVLQVSDGSLYPALHKLEQAGWIAAKWRPSENNRRARFYSLTRLGRRHLEKETGSWDRLSSAISQVIKLREA